MTLIEQIQLQAQQLPPEKQKEALDFIGFLQQRLVAQRPAKRQPLRKHPAFGSWRGRKIDALEYQQNLRAEWDSRS